MTTDLREQLQAALGGAYQLERELGGGGMSRVFAAEETALGRKVVIKVLPPETSGAVSAERFRREIQLAARLHYSHVVPVLSAGETLRAKLAREGELSIADAVRILRDVTDALCYAHEHGVVHRDLKPENVLLAGGEALVTDFGVAKALAAAGAEDTITSAGVALGTPAYMAPSSWQRTRRPTTASTSMPWASSPAKYSRARIRSPVALRRPCSPRTLSRRRSRSPDDAPRCRPRSVRS